MCFMKLKVKDTVIVHINVGSVTILLHKLPDQDKQCEWDTNDVSVIVKLFDRFECRYS